MICFNKQGFARNLRSLKLIMRISLLNEEFSLTYYSPENLIMLYWLLEVLERHQQSENEKSYYRPIFNHDLDIYSLRFQQGSIDLSLHSHILQLITVCYVIKESQRNNITLVNKRFLNRNLHAFLVLWKVC